MQIPTKSLENGEMPVLGLGTWKLKGAECTRAVSQALEMGYTHIDTALIYGNQEAIGRAIRDHDRSKLWITSKVWRDDLSYDGVMEQAARILNELGTDYLDLLLVHWPNEEYDVHETMRALKELQNAGKVRNIGVSNFMRKHLEAALEAPGRISVDQVEYHAHLNQDVLLHYCDQRGIALTAYCPLRHGELADDPVLARIGEGYGKSAAQVALRWLTQKGMVAIPKAGDEQHLRENLQSLDFELSDQDMQRIDAMTEHERVCEPDFADFK